ncbi:MAG: hypothetical protein AAF231_02035 [Pseudomonadota bacterium]
MRSFTDEDLTAYLDGEASAALTHDIEKQLEDDPALAAELQALRAAEAAFTADQDALLSLAPSMPALPATPRTTPAWITALGGMAAGLVIAAGFTWSLMSGQGSGQDPDWRAVVANYQSLYVTETLAGVAEPQSVSEAKLAELSGVLGLDLTDLPKVDGLNYRRAQQLGYQGTPLAQLTFLTEDGGPVALCILQVGGPDSDGVETQVLDGLAAYSWVDNGYGVLLIGPLDDARLEGAAETFRNALKDPAA